MQNPTPIRTPRIQSQPRVQMNKHTGLFRNPYSHYFFTNVKIYWEIQGANLGIYEQLYICVFSRVCFPVEFYFNNPTSLLPAFLFFLAFPTKRKWLVQMPPYIFNKSMSLRLIRICIFSRLSVWFSNLSCSSIFHVAFFLIFSFPFSPSASCNINLLYYLFSRLRNLPKVFRSTIVTSLLQNLTRHLKDSHSCW